MIPKLCTTFNRLQHPNFPYEIPFLRSTALTHSQRKRRRRHQSTALRMGLLSSNSTSTKASVFEDSENDKVVLSSIKQSQTMLELDRVLYSIAESFNRHSSSSSSSPYSLSKDTKIEGYELRYISIRVTAAALRRAAHISLKESREEQRNKTQTSESAIDQSADNLRQVLLEKLLDAVGTTVIAEHRQQQKQATTIWTTMAAISCQSYLRAQRLTSKSNTSSSDHDEGSGGLSTTVPGI